MQVSVIIPVYNRAKFVEKAVRSALMQEETAEVLFIDDGSLDNSLEIGHTLAKEDKRVKVFQHPNDENLGPAATRNVGLKNAQFPFIAFLDSDDWYLAERFLTAKKVFENSPSIDGVYDAVQYENEENFEFKEKFPDTLITYRKLIPPTQLFDAFFIPSFGYFVLDGLVIKKEILSKVGFFDENLRQAEDTDWILRLTLKGHLQAGNLETPVAIVGNHNNRSVLNTEVMVGERIKFFQKWFKKSLTNNYSKTINRHILLSYLHYHPFILNSWNRPFKKMVKKVFLLIYQFLKHPILISKIM
jgi:glycosyltransferase involved in cell wall biosynthesis